MAPNVGAPKKVVFIKFISWFPWFSWFLNIGTYCIKNGVVFNISFCGFRGFRGFECGKRTTPFLNNPLPALWKLFSGLVSSIVVLYPSGHNSRSICLKGHLSSDNDGCSTLSTEARCVGARDGKENCPFSCCSTHQPRNHPHQYCWQLSRTIVWALRAQRLKKFNLAWNFQSRLKISIPTFRIPHKKNRGLLGGSLEIFNLDWKFQSRRAILNFFNLWALREFCRGGNSDHGLSFLFSTDLQCFWILAVQILCGLSFDLSFLMLWGWGWFPYRQSILRIRNASVLLGIPRQKLKRGPLRSHFKRGIPSRTEGERIPDSCSWSLKCLEW